MSAGNGSGGDRKRRFDEFHERHGRRAFTPDFNSSLETLMKDPSATAGERVLAWAKRYAWGNYSDFAVDEEGKPQGQVDCASQIGIDKRQVNNAVRFWENRGYLRTEGRLIYPVDSPQPPNRSKVTDVYDFPSPSFRLFIETWSTAHPDEYEEFERACATAKRIRLQLIQQYRLMRKSQTSSTNDEESHLRAGPKVTAVQDGKSSTTATNDPSILIEEKEEVLKGSQNSASSSFSKATGTTTTTEVAAIAEALSEYAVCDDEAVRQLVAACRHEAPDASAEEIVAVVHAKGPLARSRPSPLGFLLTAVPRCFEGESFRLSRAQQAQAQPNSPAMIDQAIEIWERMIEEFPDHAQVPEWRERVDALRAAGKGMR